MKKIPADKAVKQFVSVSIPVALHQSLEAASKTHGRTLSAQIAHYAKIGRDVELVVPGPSVAARNGGQTAVESLARLRVFLGNRVPSILANKLETAQSPRYGVDPNNASVVIRIDPDGTVAHGYWDASGKFTEAADSPPRAAETCTSAQQR